MSITDELRRYVKDHTNWDVVLTTYPPQRTMTYYEGSMDAIADHIDAEHAEAQRRWMAELDAARDRDGSINYELEHCPACKNVADLQEALAENAKLREQLERVQPTDCEGNVLDIADTVHMLRSEYDGDHEWEDVVTELVLTKWGGDRWIVRGSKGEAWACDCAKTGYDEDAYEASDDVEPFGEPTLLEAENAKLREELEQWHRLTAGIELPEYPMVQFQPCEHFEPKEVSE